VARVVEEPPAQSLVSVAPREPAERPEGERSPRHRVRRAGRRLAVDPLSRIHQAVVAAQPLLHLLPMADRTAPERRNHAVTTPSAVVLKGNRRLVKRRQHDLLCLRWEAKAWLAQALKRNVLRRDLARLRFQLLRLPVEGLERQAKVRSLAGVPTQFRPQT
jgi:hypothetical protein